MSGRAEAFIFDFDGVVANPDVEGLVTAAEAHRQDYLLPPRRILTEYFYNHPRNRELDLGLVTVEEVREDMRPALWAGSRESWAAWWRQVEDSYAVSEPMAALLRSLGRTHRLALLSDNHAGFHEWLARLRGMDCFDVVVCSADLGIKKPAPALFRWVIEKLGTTFATTVYVDDDRNNVEAMRKHGLAGIHFRSVPQLRRTLAGLGIRPCCEPLPEVNRP